MRLPAAVSPSPRTAPAATRRGAGIKGYPSLADDDWIWGGKLADVERTIQFGIRSTHPNARTSVMPRFGVDGILDRGQIGDVTEFVLGLGNRATDPAAASRGQKVFAENCVSCHGDKGVGQRDLGAPNLIDGIWLYGGDRASLVKTIAEGRVASCRPGSIAWILPSSRC